MTNLINPLTKYTYRIAKKKAKFIDDTVLRSIPSWKAKLIVKTKSRLVAKLIGVNVEIITQDLIDDFGEQISVRVNGKPIASMKLLYDNYVKRI